MCSNSFVKTAVIVFSLFFDKLKTNKYRSEQNILLDKNKGNSTIILFVDIVVESVHGETDLYYKYKTYYINYIQISYLYRTELDKQFCAYM